MNYMNPPTQIVANSSHKTFYSSILRHEIGYSIYIPPDYWESEENYPVVYHIHGWQGNESSDIGPIETVCRERRAITVFMNAISSESTYFGALAQMESILIKELIAHIDRHYRTNATREGRMLSGFSMGGAMAFYYAVKYTEQFSAVTSYAGTFHHLYHKDYQGVGKPPETAFTIYEEMMQEARYLEQDTILWLVRQNADTIRKNLDIHIHIGTSDILFCDNEVMHLYLNALNIPHEYQKFVDTGHDLKKIV